MPDMAVQTDVPALRMKPLPTPPPTPVPEKTTFYARQHLDVYEKQADGSFVRVIVPTTITLNVEQLTLAPGTLNLNRVRQATSSENVPYVDPTWLDNAEHRLYQPFRFVFHLCKPALSMCCWLWALTPAFGVGINLGILNFRSL